MSNYKRQLPEGVQDYLEGECYNKRLLEESIRNSLRNSGFDELQTPTFEFYDVFASGIGQVHQENMLKLFDAQGRILVLRPDITMPVARIAATKLVGKMPQKLFYIGSAFGGDDAFYSSQKEFTQAGVEFLGVRGAEADAQIIATAIEMLRGCGLRDFQIDIGQVEFFKGLMEEAGVSSEDSETLRSFVDQKNNLAVELFLKNLPIGNVVKQKIAYISQLYGGEEVFEEAEQCSVFPRCAAAIENLRRVYDILCEFGLRQYLSIDLGMLQSIDYYSGIVFKGISGSLGQSLLTGGRYDNLLGEFGADVPATGFAMGIKRLLIALEKQGSLVKMPQTKFVVSSAEGCREKAYAALLKMRGEGVRAEAAFYLNKDELKEYAAGLGAQPLFVEE